MMGTYLTSKLCKLSSEYPTFDYDLEKEMMMQGNDDAASCITND